MKKEGSHNGPNILDQAVYEAKEDINLLPQIFHYWSNAYLRPMFEEYGFSNPDQFFAKYLKEGAEACGGDARVFISIGLATAIPK